MQEDRNEKIDYIEKCFGDKGDWNGWTDEAIDKLCSFIRLGAPIYLEPIKFIT